MVCAKYQNSAHVTRLYGSSDPSQPKLFHGNTCAHEMNVLSTATVLPRTTSDVNDMLTVVFVGSRKFDVDCLHVMFRVQKSKIWRFLIWLTTHNCLYTDIHLDPSIMNSYPEDGVFPGIEDRIFEDYKADVSDNFADEMSGFGEHPAQMLVDTPDPSTPFVLLEKMGVSDAEAAKQSGRSFTASALKNLVSHDIPDLVIHCSSQPVPEYNNPDLMFPTLFLL